MPDPGVTDIDGLTVQVGTDFDSVSIKAGGVRVRLDRDAAEEFARMFVAACWAAGSHEEKASW